MRVSRCQVNIKPTLHSVEPILAHHSGNNQISHLKQLVIINNMNIIYLINYMFVQLMTFVQMIGVHIYSYFGT